jgi:hypothetical protein
MVISHLKRFMNRENKMYDMLFIFTRPFKKTQSFDN